MSDPFLDALDAKAGTAPPTNVPRSVRNNNPGNIVFDRNNPWQGQTGSDGKFAIFDTPESGDRAHAKLLENYQKLHGINTIRGAIGRFAPPSDGNDTDAYVATVAQQLGVGPDDQVDFTDPRVNAAVRGAQQPIEAGTAMPAAAAPQPEPNDPFLQAFNGATQGGNAGSPQVPGAAGGGAAGSVPVGAADGSVGKMVPQGSAIGAIGSSLAGITPLTDSLVNGRNYIDSLRDDATGFAAGVAKVPETMLNVAGNITGAVGRQKDADTLHRWGDNVGNFFPGFASDKNSSAYGWGHLGGEIGATLPLTEIAPLAALAKAGKAGKIASGLARYGDMALQGGAAGAALSGGKDVGKAALYGAALAPVAGAVGDIVLPRVMGAAGAVSGKVKDLAGRLSAGAEDSAPAATQTIRKAVDLPAGEIEVTHHGQPFAPKPDATPSVPSSATSAEVGAALGSRGSNSGLEATAQLPKEVALHVDRLRMQGVPLDQAIREAEVTYAGAKPTIATVSRNPQDQAAVWEGAKQATAEGRALAAQIAQNNAAVVGKAQKFVQDNGGVPAQGESAETAATSLAKASDAERAKVSALYKGADSEANTTTVASDVKTAALQAEADQKAAAEAQNAARAKFNEAQQAYKEARRAQGSNPDKARDALAKARADLRHATDHPPKAAKVPKEGSGYIDISGLRRAIDNPEMASPTIEGVKSLRSGVSGLLDAYAGDSGKITLEQAESVRQAINDAYDPMGGGINGHVGRLKASLDNALDGTDAGPAYKAARAAHKAWARKYDDPEGISSLIKRDAQGNFVNGDNWRKAEGLIGSTADKPFIQIVKQLKANDDTAALQRLKASVLQRAYERATNNATDKLGNATLNGKLFFGELNKIGSAKLNALFEPAELAEIASTGRAAIHLNEAVPGTNNTSNTASALGKALSGDAHKGSKLKTGLRVAGHVAGAATGHFGGNIAVEGIHKGAGFLTERGRAKALADALRDSMSPAKARATEAAKAKRLAEGLRRHNASKKITNHTAPLVGAQAEGKR